MTDANGGTTLVMGGTGKTGRRVVERLAARGLAVRVGSRAGTPPFDWDDRATWEAALRGISRVYVTYQPDLAVPGAAETVGEFARLAARSGVRRLVLLSGRGEEGARRAEDEVASAGVEWTVLRASWLAQNFSESFLLDAVLAGEVALPADAVREPFIDADDIADAAVAALTEDGHAGRVYELTGPRALTFAEAVDEIARATGRPLRYVPIPAEAFIAGMREEGAPADVIWLMNELFTQVLDGRNAHVADGVQRALGRTPRDFGAYARAAAAGGAWDAGG
jgi:uncharacterized protein YbjT (DUF2867 family)